MWAAVILTLAAVYIASYADLTPAVRFGSSVVAVMIAAALVIFSQSGRDFSYFMRDAGNELRKVVWPKKQEVIQMTGVVFVFLTIVTIFLWLADLIIRLLLEQLMG